jgi:hypothetical protein
MNRNEELLMTMDTESSTEQRVSKRRTLSSISSSSSSSSSSKNGKVNFVQVPNSATQHKGVWESGGIIAHIPNSTLDSSALVYVVWCTVCNCITLHRALYLCITLECISTVSISEAH